MFLNLDKVLSEDDNDKKVKKILSFKENIAN